MHRNREKLLRDQRGVTLVELLVVVVIIAVLAAFAVPAYKKHVTKSNRVDGQAALLVAAQQVERFRTTGMTYVGATFNATSEKGFYTLKYADAGTTVQGEAIPNPNPDVDTFWLEVDGVGTQAADTDCTPMIISQAGVKLPAACW